MKRSQKELISQLTSQQLRYQVWLTQGILLLFSIILAFFFFDSLSDIRKLFDWDLSNILFLGLLPACGVILIDIMAMRYLPKEWWDDGGINEKIFQNASYGEIFFLCLTISIAEEWLFRGVIQSNWGIIIASMIFAFVHIRYLSKIPTFIAIVSLSFLIGLLFEWSEQNLLVVIILHFIIDFVLALYIRDGRLYHVKSTGRRSGDST